MEELTLLKEKLATLELELQNSTSIIVEKDKQIELLRHSNMTNLLNTTVEVKPEEKFYSVESLALDLIGGLL